MAIDMNTTTNPQWGRPHMNCDVVRIFRKWGFAWGGNYWPTDGMHFEWVGERRDQLLPEPLLPEQGAGSRHDRSFHRQHHDQHHDQHDDHDTFRFHHVHLDVDDCADDHIAMRKKPGQRVPR